MADKKDTVREWLETVVQGLVVYGDDVVIEKKTDEMGDLYTVIVNKEDAGKVIGKSGQHADALRLLLRCVGSKYNLRASLKINAPHTL